MEVEKGMATAPTAMANGYNSRRRVYPRSASRSTTNLLGQAADVLCLLAFCQLTETEHVALSALLERRLQRVYAGGRR